MRFTPENIDRQAAQGEAEMEAMMGWLCGYCNEPVSPGFPCRNGCEGGCTGVAARWCQVHGDCTCPEGQDGDSFEERQSPTHNPAIPFDRCYSVHDPFCPLHGLESDHADPVDAGFKAGAGI